MTNLLRDDWHLFTLDKGFNHHAPNPSRQSFQFRCAKLVESAKLSNLLLLPLSRPPSRHNSASHSFSKNILRAIQLPSLPLKLIQLHLSLPRTRSTLFPLSPPTVSSTISVKLVKESPRALTNFVMNMSRPYLTVTTLSRPLTHSCILAI